MFSISVLVIFFILPYIYAHYEEDIFGKSYFDVPMNYSEDRAEK